MSGSPLDGEHHADSVVSHPSLCAGTQHEGPASVASGTPNIPVPGWTVFQVAQVNILYLSIPSRLLLSYLTPEPSRDGPVQKLATLVAGQRGLVGASPASPLTDLRLCPSAPFELTCGQWQGPVTSGKEQSLGWARAHFLEGRATPHQRAATFICSQQLT
jgi:hypothetical protein